MTIIKWLVFTAAFWALLYFGFVENVSGAQNLAVGFVWFGMVLSVIGAIAWAYSTDIKSSKAILQLPNSVRFTSRFAAAGFLMWHGAAWTAAAELVAIFCVFVCIETARKKVASE